MSCMCDVSVVIPAYDAEGFLARAVESVLGQSIPPREILVVDDGSTDGTADVARRLGERIRYLRQENAGPSGARNRGIGAAAGEWVAFLDADDWWLPRRLERGLAVAGRYPGLNWVAGRYRLLHPDGRMIAPEGEGGYVPPGERLPNFYDAARGGLRFHTGTMLIRRTFCAKPGCSTRP